MKISLFNTMGRKIEEFVPREAGRAGLYCCGMTVYNFAHIGNMRTYVFEDILRRALEMAGYEVRHVMNVTDVGHLTSDADEGEDKMIVAMRREGKTAHQIAEFYTDAFFRHADMLHIARPHVVCKATEHIPEMIAQVERLEANGLAYRAGGNVYFDIEKFPSYGDLAGLDMENLQAGARIEVDKAKRNEHDFALWFTQSKFENQEMIWDSPWGRGYPGWHIECSAMSMKYLGEQFDIHCGGIDHVPVHHTNEIAQAEGATGKKPWVRYWVHGEWLVMGEEKMSKSKGGFVTVDTLVERGYDPLALRYFCLQAHYRQQLGFSYDALDGAATALSRLRENVLALRKETGGTAAELGDDHPALAEFQAYLADDLNVPRAMSVVWNTLRSDRAAAEKLALVYRFDNVLGLGLEDYEPPREEIPEQVAALVEERLAARKAKDWATADALRKRLADMGYALKDTAEGTTVTKHS
ncbi:cysteine--tRNA ligase [Candidatus Sumerlaeota bacterium]|nr:cysteine--tRNA ligase [Candidatus Sumerlaeota bacterium]